MAKNRMINTRFWQDDWNSRLDPVEKLLFLYLLTNNYSTLAGIYEIPLKVVAVETGIDKEMVERILARFEKDDKVIYREGWIAIKNFIKHHEQGSPKIKTGIEKDLENVPPWAKDYILGKGIDTLSPSSSALASALASHDTANAEGSRTVIALFKEINPSYETLFKRKNQHDASNRLLAREGIDRLRGAISFIASHRADRFCPRVSSPIQLEEKWAALESYGAGLKNDNKPKWNVWN